MAASDKTKPYGNAFGKSGLKLAYGSPEWHGQSWILPPKVGLEHIKFAYDLGINTFDTAAVYSDGMSEEILGQAIKEYNLPRDEIVVMTKVFGYVAWKKLKESDGARTVNQRGLSRKHIFESVKASLQRLQLDYVDVLQCHRFDSNTPIEETMHALHDIVNAGFARYIGMSSCWAWQFHAMQNYAIANNLTPFISMQNHHSLVYREEEREMMPVCKHLGVGIIPWSPLARGMLTRPMATQKETDRGNKDPFVSGYTNDAAVEMCTRIEELAKKRGVSMAQIALAWSMCTNGVTAPIIGTTSLQKITDSVAAVHLELSAEEMRHLEEPYKPLPIFGHS
ncbi:NADP-dependent oxidoreductase domain-containing protein [Mycena rebaudengoi]|nr:NADP-dependent oxidoreductase domain-containing protein [Mycena rebaudengoi]